MDSDAPFIAHLLDLVEPVGGCTARRMFGGYGIFRDGQMFGLVADRELYLKVDDTNRPEFDALGLPPFSFEMKDGRVSKMSYHRCPEAALDSSRAMITWAESALAAARRSGTKKRRDKA
jgi:DNA transformation protein and related proteins